MNHVKGNIFDSGADFILHQVNCRGVMGSGVAKQVRENYPWVFDVYKGFCKSLDGMCLGHAQFVEIEDGRSVVNLFAQYDFGYDGRCYTDYEALRKCLSSVNRIAAGRTVAIPYLMGCHRGGGDWSVVSKMIEETLVDCEVTLYEYCGG